MCLNFQTFRLIVIFGVKFGTDDFDYRGKIEITMIAAMTKPDVFDDGDVGEEVACIGKTTIPTTLRR